MEMMTQPKITGYRQLTPDEVALMNEGKALAEQCGTFVAKLRVMPASIPGSPPFRFSEEQPMSVDQRWISIGTTHLQEGFMALTRGIAQPSTF